MTGGVRKLALTLHVIASVGWLGATIAYLALAIAGNADPAMKQIGWDVIVPLAIASLVTGVIQGLGTEWGLFRHTWVFTKLVLTTLGTSVLVLHLQGVVAHDPSGHMRAHLLVHAIGGLVLLVTATVLSIFKPWGSRLRDRTSRSAPAADRPAG
jgi:hypothetical protein